MVDLAKAHFKKVDPILYKAFLKVEEKLTPQKTVRGNASLFATLAESVVSQQLSVKAADTIWARLKKACGGRVSPQSILKTSLPQLRSAGLSAAKAKTLKEVAMAIENGLSLSSLRTKSAEIGIEELTKIWGIGPWTAEMFLMFGLGHPDIFSARDLGLVRSMETLYGLKRGLPIQRLEKIALIWSPYRTIACRVLWRSRDM